jgi:hypothetical protein
MTALLTDNVTPEWVRSRLSFGDAYQQYLRDNRKAVFYCRGRDGMISWTGRER